VIDNWRTLRGFDWPGVRGGWSWSGQDKGHRAEIAAFLASVADGGPPPIPLAELLAVTGSTLSLAHDGGAGEQMASREDLGTAADAWPAARALEGAL
jgi:hypothetical protein